MTKDGFVKLNHLEVEAILSMIDQVTDVRDLEENETTARAKLELIRAAQQRKGRRLNPTFDIDTKGMNVEKTLKNFEELGRRIGQSNIDIKSQMELEKL